MDSGQLDLLREALPYIQRFKGKTFVVKLSGQVTEETSVMLSLAEEIALLLEGATVTAQVSQQPKAAKVAKGVAKALVEKAI